MMQLSDKEIFYFKRTLAHIQRVQKNAFYLIENHSEQLRLTLEDCRLLAINVLIHDRTKFSEIQFQPYIEFTWQKKQGLDGDLGVAWVDHYTKENHHPQRMKGLAIKMSDLEVIEMACDLQAMAQEFGEGSCRKYFETKWKNDNNDCFYDDFNWLEVTVLMDKVISIFEKAALGKDGEK